MTQVPTTLSTAYREGRLLPFIGAGVSMGVHWPGPSGLIRGPSWRELVDEAARLLGFDDPELLRVRGEDLQILEYFREQNGGRFEPLTNWLVRDFNPPDDALKENEVLKALALLDGCNLMYTTNFDSFLERALRLNGRKVSVVSTEEEIAKAIRDGALATSTEVCQVVKFHGDLEHQDQMVVSEKDYQKRLSLSTSLDDRLKADLLGRIVLFIGYSFRDWNVSYLYHVLNDIHGDSPDRVANVRGYITVADPSHFEISLFRARRLEVIPITGNDMSNQIATLLTTIGQS